MDNLDTAKKNESTPNLFARLLALPGPTLGGQQVWLDVFFYARWRIQKNMLTGHFRLLSPNRIRRYWGAYKDCLSQFHEIKKKKNLVNPDARLVLLVHGLGGFPETFMGLRRALKKKGVYVDHFNYPSATGTIHEQVEWLEKFLSSLDGISNIIFICHSLGGLIVRLALSRKSPWREKIHVDGLVMIGVPNRGAALADFVTRLKAADKISPKVKDNLTTSFAENLPPVQVRHGLIAGTTNNGKGINPVVPGNDDGIVGVEEVWLPGSTDRLLVKSDHITLPNRKKTIAAVLRFLDGGKVGI